MDPDPVGFPLVNALRLERLVNLPLIVNALRLERCIVNVDLGTEISISPEVTQNTLLAQEPGMHCSLCPLPIIAHFHGMVGGRSGPGSWNAQF